MKVLVIGGSGFIGPFVVRDLAQQGHDVTVLHRGQSKNLPDSVQRIVGDRNHLARHLPEFHRLSPDAVIDVILSNGGQAVTLMQTFRGVAGRVIALSSGDVYRALGVLHGSEPGPLQPVPLTEESELRAKPQPYRPELMQRLRTVMTWLDDEYDKIPVERAVMSDPQLPGTVLRLPMVYGPRDPLHRLHPILKRMDDRRPAILIQEDAARWRGPRGYVENVAAAIALATISPKAAGRIYNVADAESPSELEWAQHVGRAAGWKGSVVAIAKELTPAHLRVPYDSAQHWTMSSARIREELGFSEPVSQAAALERTIAWERENPPSIDPRQFDYAAEDAALAALEAAQRNVTS